jgi:hypothetical protein
MGWPAALEAAGPAMLAIAIAITIPLLIRRKIQERVRGLTPSGV